MKVTGRVIRPGKFFAYPIVFTFNPNRDYRFKLLENIDFELSVKDKNNHITVLDLISPLISKETLGIYLVPDGNTKDKFIFLQTKVSK